MICPHPFQPSLGHIREHMRRLGEGFSKPQNINAGVCHEMWYELGVHAGLIVARWPDGDRSLIAGTAYPIEGDGYTYACNRDKWGFAGSDHGLKRRALCIWIADNITEEDLVQ